MSDLDELAITLGKMGEGPWELELDSGETVEARLTEVEVEEESGFHAEGKNDEEEFRVELTTGPQVGGPIRLRRRSLYEDEWEEVGEVVDAAKQD